MKENQLLRITQAAASYFKQAETTPQPHHFDGWLESMNGPMRNYFRKQGFEASKGVLDFRWFVAKLNNEGLDAHMRQHLSGSDYEAWRRQGK